MSLPDSIALLSLFISIASVVVAVVSWRKSRVIYEIEELVIRKINGTHDDMDGRGLPELNQKLNTGHYTILEVLERTDGDQAVLLHASSDPHGMSEHIGENEKIRYIYKHMTQLALDSLLRRFIDVFRKLALVQFRIKAILGE